jgi:hypothetical protein
MDNRFDSILPRSAEKKETIGKWESLTGRDFDRVLGNMVYLALQNIVVQNHEDGLFGSEIDSIKRDWQDFIYKQHSAIDRCLFNYIKYDTNEIERQSSKDWDLTLRLLKDIKDKISFIPEAQSELISLELERSHLTRLDQFTQRAIKLGVDIAKQHIPKSRPRGRAPTAISLLAKDLFQELSMSWDRQFKRTFTVSPTEREVQEKPNMSGKPEFVSADIKLIFELVKTVEKKVSITAVQNALKILPSKKSEK